MSEQTNIAWCDSTINFWSGCTKVSDGCAHCYAETLSKRNLGNVGKWGKGAPRQPHDSAVKLALKLNKKPWVCELCGEGKSLDSKLVLTGPFPVMYCQCCKQDVAFHRRRIFSLSLGDWLDDDVSIVYLARMLDTIRQCDQVTWILCTKRPENWYKRVSYAANHCAGIGNDECAEWLEGWTDCIDMPERGAIPQNIILLTSVENQEMADKRIPELLRIPAACRGLSLEPLLGPVDVSKYLVGEIEVSGNSNEWVHGAGKNGIDIPAKNYIKQPHISWLIIGGESGNGARPCNVDWIRDLAMQGQSTGVATFVKQLGANVQDLIGMGKEWPSETEMRTPSAYQPAFISLLDKKGGDPAEWPFDLRVQEFPSL